MSVLRSSSCTMTLFITALGLVAGCSGSRDTMSPEVRKDIEAGLAEYEAVRTLLAADEMNGVSAHGNAMTAVLVRIPSGEGFLPERSMVEARAASRALAHATSLEDARESFAHLSHAFIDLVSLHPDLAEGRYLYECTMTEGFNQWIQSSKTIKNPYKGSKMLGCGSVAEWHADPRTGELVSHSTGEGDIAYYTCAMHPSVRRTEPGTCPVCSMDLVGVTHEELETGIILVDTQRRQLIGVRTASVERSSVKTTIRAVGKIVYDETRLTDVSLKIGGWIGELHADAMGMRVRRGEPLFTLYSPDLYTAQQEYLTALQSQRRASGTSAPNRADYLVEAARERLRLWDLTESQIVQIGERDAPLKYFPFLSPTDGHVVEKNVVEGASVEPGAKLYRIANLDRVWIEAEIYESDLSHISEGQLADVELPYLPDRRFSGKVTFVYPYLDQTSRTGRVRVELDNPNMELKPDMYANVDFELELGSRLVIPESAVVYAGTREFVFVDLGEGRLRPQQVETGVRTEDYVEITKGLHEGDQIVTSGNFLIAAESRLKTALEQW